jgi:hypothetical protein
MPPTVPRRFVSEQAGIKWDFIVRRIRIPRVPPGISGDAFIVDMPLHDDRTDASVQDRPGGRIARKRERNAPCGFKAVQVPCPEDEENGRWAVPFFPAGIKGASPHGPLFI